MMLSNCKRTNQIVKIVGRKLMVAYVEYVRSKCKMTFSCSASSVSHLLEKQSSTSFPSIRPKPGVKLPHLPLCNSIRAVAFQRARLSLNCAYYVSSILTSTYPPYITTHRALLRDTMHIKPQLLATRFLCVLCVH